MKTIDEVFPDLDPGLGEAYLRGKSWEYKREHGTPAERRERRNDYTTESMIDMQRQRRMMEAMAQDA
jgi:hypothetical protein